MIALALTASLLFLAAPEPATHFGLQLAKNGLHEESERLLVGVKSPGPLYSFTRLLNNFVLNDRTKATQFAKEYEDAFSNDLPMRYKHLADGMIHEIKHWKDNDLPDIGRDMNHIAGRLGTGKGGAKTQEIQKVVITKLDMLIKEQEDKNNQAKGQGKGEDQAKGPPMPGQGQGQPAPDSTIMGGSGKGKVDDKKLREVAEQWGTLPPDRRAAIVQEITRDLPVKYRPMIEEYFRALNRVHPK